MDIDVVIGRMVAIRDRRSELKKAWAVEDDKLKEQWEKGEAFLMQHLQSTKQSSAKFDTGTIFTKTNMRWGIQDKSAFKGFIKKTGEFDLVNITPNSPNLKSWVDNNSGELPPGVTVSPEISLNVRRPSTKKGESDE